MKELILPTNMHCGSCVAKLGKVLDAEPKIHHWKADVSLSGKPVAIHGAITEAEAIGLIQEAGFQVGSETPAACDMPAETIMPKPAGYWLAFLPAAVAGFLTPLPYNYYQLKKHNRACH